MKSRAFARTPRSKHIEGRDMDDEETWLIDSKRTVARGVSEMLSEQYFRCMETNFSG